MTYLIVSILVIAVYFANGFHTRIHNKKSRRYYKEKNRDSYSLLSLSSSSFEDTLLEKYDPLYIESYYSKRPLLVWERLVDIGSPLLGWWLLQKYDNITSSFYNKEEQERRLNLRAADLKDAIVQGGSTALIKAGQALSLRSDVVKSPEYVRELTKLQDEVGTFSDKLAMDIIRRESGHEPEELFEFQSSTAIASASIGQVYKAKYKYTNRTVAIKVQRPELQDTVPLDLYILRRLAAYIRDKKGLRSDLAAITDEFGCQLYNEMNYTKEAENSLRFGELHGEIPNIKIPESLINITTSKMLVQEFIEGEKGPWEADGERMLTVGLQCSVLQLLDSGLFHADPHQGNLLKTPDGHLAYLDFGMMSEVTSENRYALIGTVLGLVNKDFTLIVDSLKTLQLLPVGTDTNVVVNALTGALDDATGGGSGSNLNFTQLNTNLKGISYLLPISLPPYYTLIVRSLTILEGLALKVDSEFRLIKGAYPFIAKQILNNNKNSPELQNLLKAVLLTPQGRIKWSKLEKFVNLAGAADKALDGDFQSLKRAQDASDIRREYGIPINVAGASSSTSSSIFDDSEVSSSSSSSGSSSTRLEVIDAVLTYLISDNGAFLREPLISEIAETVDSLGLAAASLISVASNDLVPRPKQKPDRELVERALMLIQSVLIANSENGNNGGGNDNNNNGSALALVESLLQSLSNTNTNRSQLTPILQKSGVLVRELVGRLVETQVKRGVREIVTPQRVRQGLNPLLSVADILLR